MHNTHQWRLLPRPRTPQIVVDSNNEERKEDRQDGHKDDRKDDRRDDRRDDRSERSDRASMLATLSSTTSMSELLQAPEHKRHSRPKLFTRASQYFGKTPSLRFSNNFEFSHVKAERNLQHDAKVDSIVSSITTAINNAFNKPLSVQTHGPILRVFEAFRVLSDEKDELEAKLADAVSHNNTTLDTLEGERRRWKDDELNYKAEIKRLEVIIASGKTGLAEVTLFRQTSLIGRGLKAAARHHDRHNDSSQESDVTVVHRAVRPLSPSHSMSVLSRSFSRSQNRGALFIQAELPLGTPPTENAGLGLSNVQLPRHWVKDSDATSWTQSIPSTRFEYQNSEHLDDDFSSDDGDLLPDEIDQQNLTAQAIEHVATLIAEAKHITVASTMGWLQRCMTANSDGICEGPPSSTSSSYPDSSFDQFYKTQHTEILEQLSMRRRGEKMEIETENKEPLRPFSFFESDDTSMVTSSAPPETTSTVYNSDFSSVMLTSHSQSMIPSPVSEHLLAHARREDSASSLVTSLHRSPCSESALPRTPSGASSRLSVATAVRQRPGGSNIVDGLNNMRNSNGSRSAEQKSPVPFDQPSARMRSDEE